MINTYESQTKPTHAHETTAIRIYIYIELYQAELSRAVIRVVPTAVVVSVKLTNVVAA